MTRLPKSARKVQRALDVHGLDLEVVELPESTRTALEAARAIGTTPAQIAKSLVFCGRNSRNPLLILASGANRVDETLVAKSFGESIEKAGAEYVRQTTGFVIGAVPPTGHSQPIQTFIDEDLLQFAEIWAAAGTPRSVFKLRPGDLARITGGKIIRIRA